MRKVFVEIRMGLLSIVVVKESKLFPVPDFLIEFLVIDQCTIYCSFFEEFALGERLLYLSTPPVSEG